MSGERSTIACKNREWEWFPKTAQAADSSCSQANPDRAGIFSTSIHGHTQIAIFCHGLPIINIESAQAKWPLYPTNAHTYTRTHIHSQSRQASRWSQAAAWSCEEGQKGRALRAHTKGCIWSLRESHVDRLLLLLLCKLRATDVSCVYTCYVVSDLLTFQLLHRKEQSLTVLTSYTSANSLLVGESMPQI